MELGLTPSPRSKGIVSLGHGGTGQAGGASAAPSLPPFGWVSRDVTSPLTFCQWPPPAQLSQCSCSSARCPCRVQGSAAFPGTMASLPRVPEPYNPLIPLGQGIPAGLGSAKFQIWLLNVSVTIPLHRAGADVGSLQWGCTPPLAPRAGGSKATGCCGCRGPQGLPMTVTSVGLAWLQGTGVPSQGLQFHEMPSSPVSH